MKPKYTLAGEEAKKILVHYLSMLFHASGLSWDSDNEAEIETLIDNIIIASVRELDEI